MKKLLDFLIIFLLSFLIINFFQKEENKIVPEKKVLFEVTSPTFNIPASVILKIKNNTSTWIKINTCKNIIVNNSWENIKFSDSFCKDLNIKSTEIFDLKYSTEYQKFLNAWDYVFKINVDNKESIIPFKIENKWTISKIFSAFFYQPIYNLMVFLIEIFSMSLGWWIITITIIIKLILLWPQHKMMVSQKKLQNLQPKIKKIQEENKWNQQAIWMKLMELYKEEKVNPMWSCGFLLIQMPIFIVMYNVILSIKDPSNSYYLYSIFSDFDLNNISNIFFNIDLLWTWWIVWLFLAIFVAIVQFIQVKLSLLANKPKNDNLILEKKPWEDSYNSIMPDPEMMNKFMLYWMPVMVWVFTYSLMAWVGIYWAMSTVFMIIQQLIVNKITKK